MRGDTANENKQFKETIEKGNEEVKLTSDVHNRPPYSLINRVVGCVHHDMFTLYTCIWSGVIVFLRGILWN